VRHMSFALTTPQMRARTKTVTRRLGSWLNLKPGTLLLAVEKSQGLRKGEKVRPIGVIRVVSVKQESLGDLVGTDYGDAEAVREGFPEHSGEQFVEMFQQRNGSGPGLPVVTRIEFEHVEDAR
jgi:hypothetical protein